jgi:hypothetical protein
MSRLPRARVRSMTALALLVAVGVLALPGDAATPEFATDDNTPYDGRFTFVRLRFTPLGLGMGSTPPWAHDYPRAERNLMRILNEITLLAPRLDGSNVLRLDDPELSRFPFAYLCEPGYWSQTEAEALALRAWLRKGGFLIVDDFRGGEIHNFRDQLRRVIPGAELIELDVSHPIFHSFFDLESLDFPAPYFRRFEPVYYGVFEDNDPQGRMLAIVNYNNDIGDYWEFADAGWMPVQLSNEAYKLGVNYIVYAMTH